MIIIDPTEGGLIAYPLNEHESSPVRLSVKQEQLFNPDGEMFSLDYPSPVGIILYQGADRMIQPVVPVDEQQLQMLEACLPYEPVLNSLTLQAAKFCAQAHLKIKPRILCDSAFFSKMPEKNRYTALPYEMASRGIQRFGGDGFFHQAMWQETQLHQKETRRLISIHLGKQTSVAAIQDGEPVETSIGFSAAEGIPSATGCGNLDASIPITLVENGFTPTAVRHLLTQESGMLALTGTAAAPAALMGASAAPVDLALAILEAGIIKAIGSAAAALGGVDAVCFGGDRSELESGFPLRVARRLGLLGVEPASASSRSGKTWNFAAPTSALPVVGYEYDRISILAGYLQNL